MQSDMSNYKGSRKYFFLAVNTGYVTNRLPDQRCYDFYVNRSKHGLHCAIVGNVVVPGGIASNDVCAEISNSDEWRRLALGIAEQGALPGIQLSSAWHGYRGMKAFLPHPGEDRISEYRQIAASMTPADVRTMFSGLDCGTELAIQAGFRHVQLHAAHGYLFNLMVDHRLSPHSDLALDLIHKWATNLKSADIESSLRFSLYSGDSSLDDQGQNQFIDTVANLPVGYLDVSAGYYNINKRLIYPTSTDLLAARHSATLELAAAHPKASFILSGKSTAFFNSTLPDNVHIGICRDIIANPDFMKERSSGCVNSMKCHYFSRGQSHITCGRWISRKE